MDTLIFGDSMAHGFMANGKKYPCVKELQRHLGKNTDVREHGIGGEEAIQMLSRLTSTLDKYDNARRGPTINHVVLFAGTNDIPNFLSKPKDITDAHHTLIKACGKRKVHITTLHATILEEGSDRITAKRNKVNETIRSMANDQVFVIDLDREKDLEVGTDGVHFTKASYKHTFQMVASSIQSCTNT